MVAHFCDKCFSKMVWRMHALEDLEKYCSEFSEQKLFKDA